MNHPRDLGFPHIHLAPAKMGTLVFGLMQALKVRHILDVHVQDTLERISVGRSWRIIDLDSVRVTGFRLRCQRRLQPSCRDVGL
jgi:hypothetical protein